MLIGNNVVIINCQNFINRFYMSANYNLFNLKSVWQRLRNCLGCTLVFSGLIAPTLAQATPVSYRFDYEITSNFYPYGWTELLFEKGTKGSGIVTLQYQAIAEGSIISPGLTASYTAQPFNVRLSSGADTFTLIDMKGGKTSSPDTPYDRQGIVVVDIHSAGLTYDSILVEGISGPVVMRNANGNPMAVNLHSQLALHSLSNVISDYSLSGTNIDKIAKNPIRQSLSIFDRISGGQISGTISNFQILEDERAVPEPSSIALIVLAMAGLVFARRRKV